MRRFGGSNKATKRSTAATGRGWPDGGERPPGERRGAAARAMRRGAVLTALSVALPAALGGCGGDARVDLAAAQSVESLAAALGTALGEYHAEVEAADDARESGAVAAFVARVRRDVADETLLDGHTSDFEQALRRIRTDRGVEAARQQATRENLAALGEVARGLRKLAIESLTVQDEARRYIVSLLEARTAAKTTATERTCGQ